LKDPKNVRQRFRLRHQIRHQHLTDKCGGDLRDAAQTFSSREVDAITIGEKSSIAQSGFEYLRKGNGSVFFGEKLDPLGRLS